MTVDIPGTGHPDGEERAMPHGTPLETGVAITATPAGAVASPAAGYWDVAAYRSVVVAVRNTGANDITVTPRWNFYQGTFPIRVSGDAQTVPAGTTKRLLFQNQGDIIDRLTFTAPGGNSAMNYYLTGSNLDPLVSSRRDMLYMIQRTPVQSIPNNAGTLIEFGPTAGTRFYTNAATDWVFTTTGAGDYNGLSIVVPGLFLIYARLTFAAPGNYNKTLQLNATSGDTNPIGNANEQDSSFDANAQTLQATTLLALSPSFATVAGNAITVAGLQVSGAAVTVDQATLWIARLGSVFP